MSPPSKANGHEEGYDDSKWSFDSFIRELKEKEEKHKARKECTFRKVLSSLGGPEKDGTPSTCELPLSIVNAWQTRSDGMALAEAKARSDNQKREVRTESFHDGIAVTRRSMGSPKSNRDDNYDACG